MAAAKKKKNNGFFNKFTESYTSLVLGAIVVLVAGILFISFAKNRNTQTSSTTDQSTAENSQDKSMTSSTYTIKPGDDLWSISEDIYKDGFKWIEIAKVNKIENPGMINAGDKLIIANISQKKTSIEIQPSPAETKEPTKVMENNSITGDSYKIKEGDNLWDISVRAYGDGYKWVELAKANNLDNPDLIFPYNTLKLPR